MRPGFFRLTGMGKLYDETMLSDGIIASTIAFQFRVMWYAMSL